MPEKKYIQFIDSDYNTLFYLPDGGRIKVTRYDGAQFERTCKFLDECHTSVNGECFHICQWAEIMERNGNKYEPLDYITDPEFYPKRYLTPTSAALRPPYFILDTTREYGFGYSPGSKREYRYCIFDLTPEKRRGEFTTGTFRLYGGSLKDLRPKDYGFDTAKIKAVVGRKPKARQEPER